MKSTIHDLSHTAASRNLGLTRLVMDLHTIPYGISLLRVSLGILFLAHGLLKATLIQFLLGDGAYALSAHFVKR